MKMCLHGSLVAGCATLCHYHITVAKPRQQNKILQVVFSWGILNASRDGRPSNPITVNVLLSGTGVDSWCQKNDPHCFGRTLVFLIRISYDNRREGNMKEGDVVVGINFQLLLNRKRIPFLSLSCKDGIFCLLWSFHSALGILC